MYPAIAYSYRCGKNNVVGFACGIVELNIAVDVNNSIALKHWIYIGIRKLDVIFEGIRFLWLVGYILIDVQPLLSGLGNNLICCVLTFRHK